MSDLVKYQAPDVMTLGAVFTKSGYFQDAREAAQAVVKILAGQELGFGPVASMTGIYIVKGRVSLGANLIAAAVKKGGKYNYRVAELTEGACKIIFFEGKEQIGESSFSMADAQAAGLVNENYRKFSRNMLFARAMSNGAKWFCADVFGGPVYTPDELGAQIDMETGEMLERPKDEVVTPAKPETVAQQAERLFPDEAVTVEENQPTFDEAMEQEKAAVVRRIGAGFDTLALGAGERVAKWEKHTGKQGKFMTTEPSLDALNMILDELLSMAAAQKSRKR